MPPPPRLPPRRAAKNPLAFLNGFEGEIGIAMKNAKPSAKGETIPPILLQIKSDKVRVDIPPGIGGRSQPNLKGYVVLNTPEKKLFLVMEDQKQVVVVDLNQLGEQMKAFAPPHQTGPTGSKPGGPTHPMPKVTKTGVTDKIAGYTCENWEVTDETHKAASICIADQGASWFHLPITGIPTEYAWAAELMDGKHFPLRGIMYQKDGTEEARVEVTKLEKKPMAATLFDIPAGYKVIDVATMAQQLGAGARPGTVPAMPPVGQPPKKHK
jgi:hypothetical protein